MAAIERIIPLVSHLPPSIRDALGRRVRELVGLGLIALSGIAAAALMTWSVQDPSLSHATSRAIRNVLGYPGAIGADLLMQILGLGAIMLILPIAVWGWRMLTHRSFDREALRLGCWLLATVLAAGFASCFKHGGAWPLPTGLGGVVGDALVRAPAVVFGPAGLVVRYGDVDTLVQALADLEGQLTATVHAGSDDLEAARRILPVLEDRAGRLLWCGWPTGVEVASAMVHGGPWPATSAPTTTSVGTLAIDRWLRPVCYQDLPIALLPPELQP